MAPRPIVPYQSKIEALRRYYFDGLPWPDAVREIYAKLGLPEPTNANTIASKRSQWKHEIRRAIQRDPPLRARLREAGFNVKKFIQREV